MGAKATKAVEALGLDLDARSLTPQEVRKVWDIFDRDGSGSLDKQEGDAFFKAWLHSRDIKDKTVVAEKTAQLWLAYDVDGDGLITFEEITGEARRKLQEAEALAARVPPTHELLLDSESQPECFNSRRLPVVSFASAGTLAVAGAGGGICVYDFSGEGSKPRAALSRYVAGCRTPGSITTKVRLSPNGERAASTAGEGSGRFFEWTAKGAVAGAAPLAELDFQGAKISSSHALCYSADSTRLAVADQETVYVFESGTGAIQLQFKVAELRGHPSVAFAGSTDEFLVVCHEWHPAIHVHSSADGTLLRSLEGHSGADTEDGVQEILVSIGERTLLYSGGRDNTIRCWDVARGGACLWSVDVGNWPKLLTEVGPGRVVAIGDSYYTGEKQDQVCFTVVVVDQGSLARTLNNESTAEHHVGWISGIASTASGLLVTSGADGRVNVWESQADKVKQTCAGFSGHENLLAVLPSGACVSCTGTSRDDGNLWGVRVFQL